MRKTMTILLSIVCIICILPFQNVLALDVVTPTNKIPTIASYNLGGIISPLSLTVEKPTLITEELQWMLGKSWVVYSRTVQYTEFRFINGIYVDEARSYVEEVSTGLLTKKRIQHYYYIIY